jgi:two-component sensor histidine kinase
MSTSEPPRPDPDHPILEPAANGDQQDLSQRTLELRIRQQEILAELGVAALQRTGFSELLDRTVQLAAEGLKAELCKILEYIPEEKRLLLRAGVGWDPGLIGIASVGADLESPSGFALQTGKPVISNHLEREERFRTPDLLKAHGVRRAINVILQGDGAPFGVLEVDSRSEGEFSQHDIAFLQGAANILGMAIERQRYERTLRDAVEHQKVLVNEINHRVKNSLQLVASMFSLQASTTPNTEVAQSLQQAMSRVTAVARIHERLYRTTNVGTVDLAAYLGDICEDLAGLAPQCQVKYEPERPIPITTDRAVRVALLVTELVTNAAKHAYPEGKEGPIFVSLSHMDSDAIKISIRDRGAGLPATFDDALGTGLGMRIVRALITQTDANLTFHRHQPGSEFVIEFPLQPEAPAHRQ